MKTEQELKDKILELQNQKYYIYTAQVEAEAAIEALSWVME